jgi:spore germination cell wall hydrolase CwlJ-like protein
MSQITLPAGNDQLILARTIYGEAAGEPDQGKRAVAQVVMNRASSGRYSKNVADVCLQPSQFSCWNANDPNRSKIIDLQPNDDETFYLCFTIAGDALAGDIKVLTPAVMHYFADYISKPSWVLRSPDAFMEKKIGHHLFYRGIE